VIDPTITTMTEPTDAERIDLAQLVPAACGLGLASFCFLLLAFCV
jgi:hypothetical protein